MKILIIDDSKLNREIIKNELELTGYETIEASNGKEGISKIIMNDDIDLVTLDVEMDGLNGFETLEKIRNGLPDNCRKEIPVVFVTSNDTLDDRMRGFDLGAADFVSKSYLKGELAQSVNAILKPDNEFLGSRVLVVEDNLITQTLIKNILVMKGVDVVVADDGKKALEIIKNDGDKIDLILSDLILKQMHGDELCYQVKYVLGMRDIPYIILSALSNKSKVIQLFKMGATDYLFKPFVKEEFVARMRTYLKNVKKNQIIKKNLYELQEAYKQLNASQKENMDLVKKNSVLAMAVTANHEINQPLSVIQMNLDLFMMDFEGSEFNKDQQHKIDIMYQSIDKIKNILGKYKNIRHIEFTDYVEESEMVEFKED